MSIIAIFQGNPTAGGTDGVEVSSNGALTAPISFVLDAAQNETKTLKLAVRTGTGYVTGGTIDLSGKVDKVTSAVQGNLVTFGTGGAIVDSGITFATDADVTAMLEEYFPTNG